MTDDPHNDWLKQSRPDDEQLHQLYDEFQAAQPGEEQSQALERIMERRAELLGGE